MSTTPDYDMAPPAAPVTAPSPAAGQHLASGAAAATDPGAQRPQRRRAASQKDNNLAGLLIPGGAITGLISLCWLVHAFGLPVVIFAILAAAATAATAAVIKVSRRAAKAASRRGRAGRGAGGGGPGGGRRGGLGGGRGSGGGRGLGGGRSSAGNRSGGAGGARRSGGGSKGSGPGAMSRKPAGMGALKTGPRTGPKNSSKGALGGRGGLGGSRSTAAPKPLKGSQTKGGLGGGGKDRKGLANSTSGGKGGLLGKLANGIGSGLSGGGAGKNNRKSPAGLGGGITPKSPKAPKTPKPTKTPKGGGGKTPAGTGTGKGGGKTKTPKVPGAGKGKGGKGKGKSKGGKHRRYSWKKNPLRKSRALAKSVYSKGKGACLKTKRGAAWTYRKVTSPKFRHRMRQAATPFRAMYRGTRKHGGKLLANAMRVGGRWLLSAHTFLGNIRLSTAGPNWLKPLAKVLHWATSPLAKLVNVSRRWTWLSTWIYKTATARPTTKPVTASGPTAAAAGTGTAAKATVPGSRTPVPSPATAPAGGTPVDTSPVHHAYPLIYAADAIRGAAAAFAASPAESMKGYETFIENLGHLEVAMCHLMQCIATVTEEDFKVNQEIPDQFRNVGIQFLMLGAFVDGIHKVFRDVHAEQLENLENPTWQGRKWDVSANWAHVMPQFAWQDPTTHAMPLMLASGAIRDAGIHIRLHPSGSMFGYEMTIEHLAPLAEALYELMETVASTTESEFAVHPAIPAMHRDAGQRFRDLGGAIQAVHLLYRLLHQEQLINLENPTYQGAKWDIGRNVS